jgi:sugar lactone lactonase YvrE
MLLIKQSLRDFCPPGVKMQFIENKQVIGVSRRCSLHRGECFFDGKSNYVIENKGGEMCAWAVRNYVYENNGDIFIPASCCYFIENNRDSCDFGIRQVLFLSETRRIGGFCSIYPSESVLTAPESEFLGTHSTRWRAQFVADTVPRLPNSHRRGRVSRSGFPGRVFACLLLLAAAPPAWAQVTFSGTVSILNTGSLTLSDPTDTVVDASGDVYIADNNNGRVVQVNPQGVASVLTISNLSLAPPGPFGLALNPAGTTLYIADSDNNHIVEVSSSGGTGSVLNTGGLISTPVGVAVDASGNVFIADSGNNRVVEVPADGSAQTVVPSASPEGVAVDGAGNLFVVEYCQEQAVEIQRSAAPTLNFAETVVFSTSTDSPQSVTAQNVGNETLNALAPGLGIGSTSFAQVAGSGTPEDCTATFSLAPGASCNLSLSFTPQTTGSILSAATFTDNALNATTASQSLTLQGIGNHATLTITASSPSMTYGGAVPAITPNYSGLVNGDSISVVTGTVCTTAATSTSPAGSAPSTSCSGARAPSYYTINYVSGTVTVNPLAVTVTPTSGQSKIYGTTDPTLTYSLSTSLVNGDSFTGALTRAPGQTVGNYAITQGTLALSTNYTLTFTTGVSFAINPAPLTITASSATMTQGGTVPTITPLYTGLVNGDTATVPTPPTCSAPGLTSSSGAGVYTTPCAGAVDPNYNISNATGTLTITGNASRPLILPPALLFGPQALDTSSAAEFVVLIGTGRTNLNISSVTITGTNSSDFTDTNHCPASLEPGHICAIDVRFTPSQTGTRETAAITTGDNAGDSPQTVTLAGTGIVQAELSPTSPTFGPQRLRTTSGARQVTLTHNLPTDPAISSITLAGADPGDFAETTTCGRSLRPLSSCAIFVAFRPQATGTRTATLTVNDSASDSMQTVALAGTGE